ncbi:MAG TPA: hypothetical protein VMT60_01730 [Candidatus Bathyarchaeia archaeon]|nr:hypothetical protein [Candidatus Bathyarchaeia archaeon]
MAPHLQGSLPLRWYLGVAIVFAGEILLARGNVLVGTYFTAIMWTGYILLVDGLLAAREGRSPIASRKGEFALLLGISIVSWYVFEGANLLLGNWSYVNLPEGTAARWLGYAWAYATISPAILITAAFIESLIDGRLRGRRAFKIGPRTERAFFFAGFLLFVIVLVFPSPWLAPLPWISVLLWFEGMNDRLGVGSFARMFREGDYGLFVSLLVSGAVCGILWESWNFWALAKWHYHVPYLGGVKIFEMPVLGYFGFPPFALECWLMYRFFRFLTPLGLTTDALGRPWDVSLPGGTA